MISVYLLLDSLSVRKHSPFGHTGYFLFLLGLGNGFPTSLF